MKALGLIAALCALLVVFRGFFRSVPDSPAEGRGALTAEAGLRPAEGSSVDEVLAASLPSEDVGGGAVAREPHRPETPESDPTSVASNPNEALPLSQRRELEHLRRRVAWLETELALCGSEAAGGTLGDWLATLRPEERPDDDTLRLMGGLVHAYPVTLTPEEGLWIVERIRQDDWKAWGPTTDEALILFLGPDRIAREVSPEELARLSEEWAEEGYFE